ncbi:hypothetical protein N7523_007832 [Penicillium sp. IBT 18751x]|nr:hypothetical protein N7523_007832 [Penicillium sp. IBT 18751x]
MRLNCLIILCLAPPVLADGWDDFTNNLATDLAPLITLFGERLTKQFLSESISLIDNLIFALSPLGVLTTVVSVIRVCGGSSLKAFIGRAQEGPAEAESELLPCVSESTAELFNDGGISRVFGRPRVLEIVAWENEDPQSGKKSVEFGTLLDAITKGVWSIKGSGHSLEDWCQMAEVHIPNLSLNKGIKRRKKIWFYCAAVIGSALQIGVIVYAIITVFIFPTNFKKNGEAVPSYAFPFFIIGSTFLFIGMFCSAVIIERSSKEYYVTPKKPSKLYWLQPGNQNVGDQVFGAFMAVKEGANSTMTKKLRYIKSVRDRRLDGQHIKIYSTILSTMFGFIMQFIGLRALHASVILTSLGATLLMSILRTCLRTERMAPDENKLEGDRETTSHKNQELDYFAFYLEGIQSFGLISSPLNTSPGNLSLTEPENTNDCLTKRLIATRTSLAKLTSRSEYDLNVAWEDMPIRIIAHKLARTIETTMDLVSSWGMEFEKCFSFPLTFECTSASKNMETPSRSTHIINLVRCGDDLRWRINSNELEAILGLWTWSLYKSSKSWRRPLSRLVGLNEADAGRETTYLYFSKWIYRQTEARMVSLKTIDSSRRLFGFESNDLAYGRDILVVKRENDLEMMAAQDIYIHLLQTVFKSFTKLGGEVDMSVGLQGTYVAENTRINEMVHCFEGCDLGSREDALLCIVPILEQSHIMPALAADSISLRERTDFLIDNNDWARAFHLVEWICQRSVGLEFEYSVYEFGNLCRRALLTNDKIAQSEGLKNLAKLLDCDPRIVFLRSRHINSSLFQEKQQWWENFARQLEWMAWNILKNKPRMDWMQPNLETFNLEQDLTSPSGATHDTENTEIGVRAMREWLTLDHLEFERGVTDTADVLCYSWALQRGFHALLYMFLVRLMELGEECPPIIQYAFIIAAKCHSDWGVQVLQRRQASIETLNANRFSALMEAVVLEDLGAVQTLLANGANPNGNDRVRDKRPLILAAMRGYLDIVKLLITYDATLEVTDSVGLSALYWAVSENQVEMARFLLSCGAEINCGVDGSTPLHSAITGFITENHTEMIHLVLEHGADVNPSKETSNLPLMRAAISSKAALVRLLLAKGANPHARDDEGLTALDWARRCECEETAAILESVMVSSSSRSVDRSGSSLSS